MEQPRNFGFGEDETMLRDQARRFFTDNLPTDRLHGLVADDYEPARENVCKWDASLWQQVAELGWTAACVPERAGGIGMPLVAAVALAEEAGRAAFPSPLTSTLSASFVLDACETAAADAALTGITEGQAFTLGLEGDVSGGSEGLSGQLHFVQDARKADRLVVRAGQSLYVLNLDADGVQVLPDTIVDLTRDQATVLLDNVAAVEVGEAEATIEKAMPGILSVVSADMVGAGEWLLQTTVEYVTTREQFDRPLGFFQAIKHPLVNLMIEVDNAKSLAYNAACAVDTGADDALTLARMAKAQASEMAVFSGSRAVQFHGGIGFTWECYVQLYFKRQMHSQVLWGDAEHHRRVLADTLVG